jgi:hypothetical protein
MCLALFDRPKAERPDLVFGFGQTGIATSAFGRGRGSKNEVVLPVRQRITNKAVARKQSGSELRSRKSSRALRLSSAPRRRIENARAVLLFDVEVIE